MIADELRGLFEQYRAAFDRLDADGAAAFYSTPAFVVKNGGIEQFDHSEKNRYFVGLMAANATQGDHAWEIGDFHVDLPADNGAIVTVRWLCTGPEGSIIWDFSDTYVVARTDEGWRILGDVVNDRGGNDRERVSSSAEALAAVDAFDAALRERDAGAAEAVWALDRADVSILGSASGEEFVGPDAVRACLAALTSRETAHGWRWVDRQVSVVGDVAWLLAVAPWQTVQPNGAVSERPYRVTGVLVRADGGWRWCHYHGSEPLGSIG